jgi:hypothetical protein
MLKDEITSLNSSRKRILGLELVLIFACLGIYTYSAIGHPELELLILPFSAILFVPFFATFAYYKGFRKTSLISMLSIFIAPIIGLIFILANTPSRAAGLLVVFVLIYSAVASAVVPYIVLATSLILHRYRNTKE